MLIFDYLIPILPAITHEFFLIPYYYVIYYLLLTNLTSPLFFVYFSLYFMNIKYPIQRMVVILITILFWTNYLQILIILNCFHFLNLNQFEQIHEQARNEFSQEVLQKHDSNGANDVQKFRQVMWAYKNLKI